MSLCCTRVSRSNHQSQMHWKVGIQKQYTRSTHNHKYRKRGPNPAPRTSTMCDTRNEASEFLKVLNFKIQQIPVKTINDNFMSNKFDYWAGEYPRGPLVYHATHKRSTCNFVACSINVDLNVVSMYNSRTKIDHFSMHRLIINCFNDRTIDSCLHVSEFW